MQPPLYCAALVLENPQGEVLIVQRPANKPMPLLWEFPGGKIEPNERPEATVVRELWEELGLLIKSEDLSPLNFTSHTYPSFHVVMFVFHSTKWDGQIILKENQGGFNWVNPHHLDNYPMPEADYPFLELLKK